MTTYTVSNVHVTLFRNVGFVLVICSVCAQRFLLRLAFFMADDETYMVNNNIHSLGRECELTSCFVKIFHREFKKRFLLLQLL